MRCFVVPAPGRYKSTATVLSSHKSPRNAYRAVDAQDDPSAWVVRRGDLASGATWYETWDLYMEGFPIIPRVGRGSYPSESGPSVQMPSARVTADERDEIVQAAASVDETASEFIRTAVFDRVARVQGGKR